MNDISIITPPDVLFNDVYSVLLVCPSDFTKQQVHDILVASEKPINVYVYETPAESVHELDWVIPLVKIVDLIFVDLDNCDLLVRQFASYMIAQHNTFYLTTEHIVPYNLISKQRVYDFEWLRAALQ